ncbi:MAG: hypothetical protein ACYCOU_00825 [Sulfobacillus sp.]
MPSPSEFFVANETADDFMLKFDGHPKLRVKGGSMESVPVRRFLTMTFETMQGKFFAIAGYNGETKKIDYLVVGQDSPYLVKASLLVENRIDVRDKCHPFGCAATEERLTSR